MSTKTTLVIAAFLIVIGLAVGVGLAVLAPAPAVDIGLPATPTKGPDVEPPRTEPPPEPDGSLVPTGEGADRPSRGGWPRFQYEPYEEELKGIDWSAAAKLAFHRRSDLLEFARDSAGGRPSSETLLGRLSASGRELESTFAVVGEGKPAAAHASVMYHPAFLANLIAVMLHQDGEPLTVAQVRELTPVVSQRAREDDELPSPRDPEGWAIDAIRREVVHRAAFRDEFFEYLTARQRRSIGAGEFTGWVAGDVLEPGSAWMKFMHTSYMPRLHGDAPDGFTDVDLFYESYSALSGIEPSHKELAYPVFEAWMSSLPPGILRYPSTPATGGGAFPASHVSLMAKLQVELAQQLADAVGLFPAERAAVRQRVQVLVPLDDEDS